MYFIYNGSDKLHHVITTKYKTMSTSGIRQLFGDLRITFLHKSI